MATISHRLGIDPIQSGYEVCQDFEEQILTDSGSSYSLFVVQCQADLVPVSGIQSPPEKPLRFGSMPEWLARLPATKTRIAWVKAWQVYQGVLMEQIKAVETTEVIRSGRQP
jgi:hypothetical protein